MCVGNAKVNIPLHIIILNVSSLDNCYYPIAKWYILVHFEGDRFIKQSKGQKRRRFFHLHSSLTKKHAKHYQIRRWAEMEIRLIGTYIKNSEILFLIHLCKFHFA